MYSTPKLGHDSAFAETVVDVTQASASILPDINELMDSMSNLKITDEPTMVERPPPTNPSYESYVEAEADNVPRRSTREKRQSKLTERGSHEFRGAFSTFAWVVSRLIVTHGDVLQWFDVLIEVIQVCTKLC